MPTYEQLPVELDEDEVRIKGRELAAKVRSYNDVEAEKKEIAKDYAERLKSIRTEMDYLEMQVRTGREFREVEVREEPDYGRNVVAIVRTDTDQIVRTRPMQSKDRQASIFSIEGGRSEAGAE